MSALRPNMRQLLNDDKDVDSLRRLDAAKFEEEVVNHLFSRYNLPREIRTRMLRAHAAETGRAGLTLPAFNDEFPSFPIYLRSMKLPKVRDENPVHRIYADFLNRKFVTEFEKLKTVLPEDVETYGLVFHWGFLRATGRQTVDERASGLVIHNREPHVRIYGAPVMSCLPRRGAAVIYLETLTNLLATIDKETPGGKWAPDD